MTPSTGMIRWGIIGAGSVCEVKSGPAFYKAPGSSLVAIMRRNKDAAEDFAKRHNVPRFYTDLDEFLKDPELDAVYVATPPGTHKELALRVCSAGKPCYVEKPMARNFAECVEMKKAFEAAKLPLYVGYYRRYLPKFTYVKSAIDSGAIGQVTGVNLRLSQSRHKFEGEEIRADWRVNVASAGGGLFMDLGSHQLDLLDMMVGPLRPLGGTARRLRPTSGLPTAYFAVEDVVCLSFETRSGALGTASWNFCSGVWEDKVDIIGELGSISFSCFNNKPVRVEISARVMVEESNASTSAISAAEGEAKRLKPHGATNGASGSGKKAVRLKDPEVTEHQAEQPDHVHQPLVEAVLRDLKLWWSLPADAPQKDAVARASHEGACSSTGDAAARTAFVMDRALEDYYGGSGSRDAAFWDKVAKWSPV